MLNLIKFPMSLMAVVVILGEILSPNSYAADEASELTVSEVEQYLESRRIQEIFDSSGDYFRIRPYDSSTSVGKIVIQIYKSEDRKNTEYMEVFRQRSADPKDLDPLLIFEGNSSNRALVSTGVEGYTTPSGVFGIDFMEKMHYSSKYNRAPMPFSIFFNGGVAIHATTPSAYEKLGSRASHGCIRTHLTTAEALYYFILNDGSKNVVIQVIDN